VFDESPVYVNGGLVRLQQVFVNLIGNAIDATAHLDEPKIDITMREEGDFVSIYVRDQGKGVPHSVAEQIFDPFFTTKDVNEGLGLGLSISYNIIQDFGGELEFENHPEQGTTFTVRLQNGANALLAGE